MVLANVLHRPIHVYELCDDSDPPLAAAAADDAADDKTRRDGGAGNAAKGAGSDVAMDVATAWRLHRHPGGQGVREALPQPPRRRRRQRRRWRRRRRQRRRWRRRDAGDKWRLRRIACFGSPKFDRQGRELHVLSADSRFPDLRVGDQMEQGNHFLALFPASTPTRQMEREAEEARRQALLQVVGRGLGESSWEEKWHAKDPVLERAHESQLAAAAAAAAASCRQPRQPRGSGCGGSLIIREGFGPFGGREAEGQRGGSGPEQGRSSSGRAAFSCPSQCGSVSCISGDLPMFKHPAVKALFEVNVCMEPDDDVLQQVCIVRRCALDNDDLEL